MNVKIYPSTIHGILKAPPSKSLSHRMVIIASLAKGTSIVKNVLRSDDLNVTIKACVSLGAEIRQNGAVLKIKGTDGRINPPKNPINLRSSGSSMRMLLGIAALSKKTVTFTGTKQLGRRPIKELLSSLESLGAKTSFEIKNNKPIVKIKGANIERKKVYVKGNISSQYVSSLLLMGPLFKKAIEIIVEDTLVSKPYILMTLEAMRKFGAKVKNNNFKTFMVYPNKGYNATTCVIEGDYSSMSYFFASAAITSGDIIVHGLNLKSNQGDKDFLDILKKMGCIIRYNKNIIKLTGPKQLIGLEVDMNSCPDIVPTLCAIAPFAKGETKIKNISHLRFKETDRISALTKELTKMGAKIKIEDNSITISGVNTMKGTTINTYHDHRMAMSLCIASLCANSQTTIKNAGVVSKSYPNFWEDFEKIGGKISYEH